MSRDSADVKCPFYKDDTSHSIRCEGLVSEACVNNFRGPQIKKEYQNKYCCRDYEDCDHSKALNLKY